MFFVRDIHLYTFRVIYVPVSFNIQTTNAHNEINKNSIERSTVLHSKKTASHRDPLVLVKSYLHIIRFDHPIPTDDSLNKDAAVRADDDAHDANAFSQFLQND